MKITRFEKTVYGYIIPALSAFFLMLLVGITVFSVKSRAKQFSGEVMANDVALLAGIFNQIQERCVILSFDMQKNPINFLTVGTFAGSEVGSMNLAYPEKWQGPYLQDNVAIKGTEYQIVRTDAGYFIVPGDGVALSSGQVVGKDILFNVTTDISALMKDDGALQFKGKPLAAKIVVGRDTYGTQTTADVEIPMLDDF